MKKRLLIVYVLFVLIISSSLVPLFRSDTQINKISAGDRYIPEKSGTVYVLVNSTLYGPLQDKLERYEDDVEDLGWDVDIFRNEYSTATQVRSFLKDAYDNKDLVGAFLVGDLPHATYEMDQPGIGYECFPIDHFYTDLDGRWFDEDDDGMYDDHEYDSTDHPERPEIWLGRLSMKTDWSDEIELYRNYFDKVHEYRTGNLSLPHSALMYLDDDWVDWTDYASDSIDDLYEDYTLINEKNETIADDYKIRLKAGYEWVHVQAHANFSATKHCFKYNDGPTGSGGNFTSRDLFENGQKSLFANIFTCGAANYTVPDYLAGWYALTEDYGLANVGSTKTGGMLNYKDFYDSLSEGNSLGEAFKEWWIKHGESDRSWTYGMTIIGDPTLSPVFSEDIDLEDHDPIKIDDDQDLEETAAEEGWNGTGSRSDPYIIEDYNIDAETYETGIQISNTTAHFRIQDCYIHSALNINVQKGTGMILDNVRNGIIEDNIIEGNYRDGIQITDSRDIVLEHNIVDDNKNNGISIKDCSNITADSNSFSKNSHKGASLNSTNGVEFRDNDIEKNNNDGVSISFSHSAHLYNNRISYNGNNGLSVKESLSVEMMGNKIAESDGSGISLKSSYDDLIQENEIEFNGEGVFLYRSEREKIVDNSIQYNDRGLILERSKEIEIKNNDLEKNFIEILYGPEDSWNTHTIGENNTVDDKPLLYLKDEQDVRLDNDYSQIILANCTDIVLEDEKIFNMYSIDIGHSKRISIEENLIKYLKTGIRLISTSDSDITNNTLQENERAIHLFASSDNVIFNNQIEMSKRDGVLISSSFKNIIANNTFHRNQENGIGSRNSFGNLVKSNLFIDNSGYGIEMKEDSKINNIYQNTFLWNNGARGKYDSDNIQASGNGYNFWNSSSGIGNYWRDWTSPDSNSNGVVDNPYSIDGRGDSKDYYPLTRSPTPLIPVVQDFNGSLESGTVTLQWSPPEEGGYLGVDQYWIYREDSSGTVYYLGNVSSDQYTFEDTSLEKKGTYTYYVRAVNLTEDDVEGSLPGEKITFEYTPEEEEEIPYFTIIIIAGILAVAVMGLLMYRKIGENKKRE